VATRKRIPLFPLNNVLFPGGVLPLRIFEPRYLEMVSTCMKEGSGFGIALILSGNEVGEAAKTYDIGSYNRIIDWTLRDDGFLGLSVQSEGRFRILSTEVQPNQLIYAEVEMLEEPQAQTFPKEYSLAIDLLRDIIAKVGGHYAEIPPHYEDPAWVSGRLAELLPIELIQKQHLLQMDDPLQRLERLCAMWDCMESEEEG
jgi:Lon protease-like protein